MSRFSQAVRLPKTLRAIFRIVREDLSMDSLDEYLWSFWGFHQEPWDMHWRARPWNKIRLRDIEPRAVIAMEVREMAAMLSIAMEDEEPILQYTRQSGEGFRFLLPTLGRYMGATREQAERAEELGQQWCEGAWCAEERRHANTLARVIKRLVQEEPSRNNPNRPMVVTASEGDAVAHLISRQTTEWNASSSYIVLASHASGSLHQLIRNLGCDEIKHLCIMSAAYQYLFGPRPWRRFLILVRKGLENYRSQQKTRSAGRELGANPITALEGIAGHLLVEHFMRRWLRTVPLRTLDAVFETPSSLPEPPAREQSEARQAEITRRLQVEHEKRLLLSRWAPAARRRAIEQRRFEENSGTALKTKVAEEFGGFKGAELASSSEAWRVRRRITRSTRFESRDLRESLRHQLRDYQIRSNRHVLRLSTS